MSPKIAVSYLDKSAIKSPAYSGKVSFIDNLDEKITEFPWSPSLFNTSGLRKNQNFDSCWVLAYDIDNDQKQLRLNDAIELFKNYNCIIGTTKNHQLDKRTLSGKLKPATDRYRLIFILDKPLESTYSYTCHWKYYKDKFGLNKIVDEAAKDPARYFFPCREIVFNSLKDETKKKLENKGPEFTFSMPVGRPTLNPTKDTVGDTRGGLSRRTLEFLAQQPNHEPWHHRFYTAALDLKTQGYTKDEAAEELAKASPQGALDQTDSNQLEDVYMNDRGQPSEKRPAWPEVVPKPNKNGGTTWVIKRNSVVNCRHLIENILKMQLRLDTRMNLIQKSPTEFLDDKDCNYIFYKANELDLGLPKEAINSTIDVIAKEKKFDPLIEGIEKNIWDGKSRFKDLLDTINFPEEVTKKDLELYEIFLRKWLIGVITKIYNPGSENNMLVFVGAQGAGKTRWFRRLAEIYPRGFIEAHINTDDKDSHLNLLKYFLWSVSELDTVTWSKDVGAIKDFITKSEVRARPAYGRHEIIGSAITSFCASVNSRDFLYDTTGNRRYLIMLVESVNANHSIDIGQVFAEAKVLMEQGERAWFNQSEIDIVNQYNERFISRSDILESFEARVSAGDRCYTLKEIAEQLQLNDLKNSDRRSIRDWMTKKKIKEVTHSNVKKYYVSITPIQPDFRAKGADKMVRDENFPSRINRMDILKGLNKDKQ